jgi:hypothetical protein
MLAAFNIQCPIREVDKGLISGALPKRMVYTLNLINTNKADSELVKTETASKETEAKVIHCDREWDP